MNADAPAPVPTCPRCETIRTVAYELANLAQGLGAFFADPEVRDAIAEAADGSIKVRAAIGVMEAAIQQGWHMVAVLRDREEGS